MGLWYLNGSDGCPVDKRKALKWFELAAEKRYPPALYFLADIHMDMEGLDDMGSQSDSRAMSLMKEAADLGHSVAQCRLAAMYSGRDRGAGYQQKYLTLAYSQGQDPRSTFPLGRFFYSGFGGLSKSLYRAKHYLEEAAGKGYSAAYYYLAVTLLQLNELEYKRICDIPGHNCIPRVLFWARKASEYEPRKVIANEPTKADAIKVIEESERFVKQSCANCKRNAECFSEKLKQCARCKAAWYCGRECQVKHWKDGHKTDCIRQK